MTKEQAKQALPLMQAFAEGKTIQTKNGSTWVDIDSDKDELILDSVVAYQDCFRVKPEDTYRSFRDAEECWQEMLKHKPFGWIKYKEEYFNIVYVNDDYVGLADKDGSAILLASVNSYQDNTFADGTPFGIREDL